MTYVSDGEQFPYAGRFTFDDDQSPTSLRKMAHILKPDVDRGIVAIEFQGPLSAEALSQGFADGLAFANHNSWERVLSDCRLASLQLSTLEIYALPDSLVAHHPTQDAWIHKLRHAIVCTSNLDDYRFLETILKNRSHNAAVFSDIELAQNWLVAASLEL